MARANCQVLELAGLAPAPVCGMILADHGAEVLRIDKVNSEQFPNICGSGGLMVRNSGAQHP